MADEVMINGVAYVPKGEPSGPIKIVVLQRGFVYVGYVTREGNQVVISNAQNIRRWGTTRGLGEIAAGGPTEKTVLDPAGTISVHELGVVFIEECNQEKWRAICK